MKAIGFAGCAAVAAFAAGSLLLSSAPVAAAGCGGYVNLAVWGCAPWDNNPPKAGVTPGYKPPAPKPTPVVRPTIQPVTGGRLVTDNGAGLISPGNKTGSTLISPGNKTGSTLISPGNRNGAGVISDNGLGVRR